MKIKPINKYVLVKYNKKVSNCHLGTIVSVSDGIPVKSVNNGVKVGNQIIFTGGTCSFISSENEYFVVALENIIGVVEDK